LFCLIGLTAEGIGRFDEFRFGELSAAAVCRRLALVARSLSAVPARHPGVVVAGDLSAAVAAVAAAGANHGQGQSQEGRDEGKFKFV
jgi:hypothetical protein